MTFQLKALEQAVPHRCEGRDPSLFIQSHPLPFFPFFSLYEHVNVCVLLKKKKKKTPTKQQATKRDHLFLKDAIFSCFWPYLLCISSNNLYVIRPMDCLTESCVLSSSLPEFQCRDDSRHWLVQFVQYSPDSLTGLEFRVTRGAA